MKSQNKKIGALLTLVFTVLLLSIFSVNAMNWNNTRAYYDFNNLNDQINANNNLAISTGTPVLVTNSSCFSGQCAYFNGNGGYAVTNTADSVFNLTNHGGLEYSVSGWIRRVGGSNYIYMGKGAGGNGGWDFGYMNEGDGMWIRGAGQINSVFSPVNNRWHMFTVTLNALDVCMYVDGSKVLCKGSPYYAPSEVSNKFELGYAEAQGGNQLVGYLDEWSFFNKTLTYDEVKQLYNHGDGLQYNTQQPAITWTNNLNNGLVHYFDFNENTSTISQDKINPNVQALKGSSTSWVNGKNGSGIYLTGTNSDANSFINFTNQAGQGMIYGTNPFSVCMWYNATATYQYCQAMFSGGVIPFEYWTGAVCSANLGYVRVFSRYGDERVTNFDGSEWHYLCLVSNTTAYDVYNDGHYLIGSSNQVRQNIINTSWILGNDPNNVGGWQNGFHGVLDEVGIWNRTLTSQEVKNLSSGILYSSSISAPNISYVTPTDEDGDSYNRNYILVNVSSSNPVDNITINVYDVNYTLINSTTTLISPNFQSFFVVDGIYYFNVTACYQNLCSYLSTRTVYIDTFNPVVDIITPDDDETVWNYKPTYINITALNTGSIDSCWFSMDNGTTNITFPSCTEGENNIFNGFDSYVVEGTNVLSVWANDTVGLYSVVPHVHIFYVDTISPQIQYVFPTTADGTDLNESNTIYVNVTATDVNLEQIIIYIYNSTGDLIYSQSSLSSPNYFAITDLSPDVYLFYANVTDTFGNYNSTQVRMVNVSFVPPIEVIVTSNIIQNVLTGTGAGLGVFIQKVSFPLFIILTLLTLVGVIVLIGYTLSNTIKEGLRGMRK